MAFSSAVQRLNKGIFCDLRRHRAHYEVTIIILLFFIWSFPDIVMNHMMCLALEFCEKINVLLRFYFLLCTNMVRWLIKYVWLTPYAMNLYAYHRYQITFHYNFAQYGIFLSIPKVKWRCILWKNLSQISRVVGINLPENCSNYWDKYWRNGYNWMQSEYSRIFTSLIPSYEVSKLCFLKAKWPYFLIIGT